MLSACHFFGAPFIFLALYLPDPYCFVMLYIGYFIIEMWFGVYLMTMAQLFDKNFSGQAIGYTIFILRLIAGNLPAIVTPIRNQFDQSGPFWSYFYALALMVPACHLLSASIFLVTFFIIKKPALNSRP